MTTLPLVAALLWSSAGDVVARVDGAAITEAALVHRLELATSPTFKPQPEQVLATMVDEALLAAEGRRLGLERSPVATARFDFLQRTAAGELFLQREIAGRISPDEKTLRVLFHSITDFAAYEVVTFDSSQRAEAALARVRAGGTMAAEAKGAITSTVHPDAKTAPLAPRAQVPAAFADALFAAAPGAVVGPFPIESGFGIAKLLRKQVGTDAEFASRRESLAAHARSQQAELMKRHVVGQLRERSRVALDEDFLRTAEELEPPPAKLDHTLAVIGGRPLKYGEIFDDIRGIRATGGHMGSSMRIAVAWREVDARLLREVAVERGLLKDPSIQALRHDHEVAATGYAAAMRLLERAPAPSKDEVEAFYERNARAFGKPLKEVSQQATAGARRERRFVALAEGIAALRKKASISVDREALARIAPPRN